jgi:predicted DNA-binding protein (UPF0278 family)
MKDNYLQKGKHTILALVMMLQVASSTGIAYAQGTEVEISINTSCFTEWDTFISSTISISEFKEYWKDILVRYNQNTCYYMDIENVLKQIDSTRSQLRQAILGCNDKQVVLLKPKYYELEIELEYLRTFVSFADKKGKLVSEEKVYKEMKQTYVDDKVLYPEDEFKKLFEKYKQKYQSKLGSIYAKCEDASLKQLVDKWKKLVNTVKGMQADVKSVKADFDKAINTPPTGMKQFINNLKQYRLDSIPPIKTPTEIFNESTKNSGSQPTIDQLQVSVVQTSQEYNKTIQKTSLTAEYEALYKHGGDSVAEAYEKILVDMNKLIESTYKPLEDLKQCAKKSGDRQCK